MERVLLAFEGERTQEQIEQAFVGTGIQIAGRARSCAETLRLAARMESGVVLCGFKLLDGSCERLYEDLPDGVHMLMLATKVQADQCETEGIVKLLAPVRRAELIESVQMLLHLQEHSARISLPRRSSEEQQIINEAKALLMDRHNMTEQEAHRYLQKRSMDAGAKLVQTAKLILGDSEFHI